MPVKIEQLERREYQVRAKECAQLEIETASIELAVLHWI